MRIVVGPATGIDVNRSPENNLPDSPAKQRNRERRRNREDRRKNVRDGVIVSLSFKNDRRVNKDRRRTGSG